MIDLVRKHVQPGDRPLRVRLVRCEVPDAEPYILVTSVLRSMASSREIGRLYRERWQIEELFKLWKSLAPLSRQFHSKSIAGIQQEIGARLLHLAICAAYFANTMDENGWCAKGLRVNQKPGISCVDRFLMLIFLAPGNQARANLEAALLRFLGTLVYKQRPGRSSPRVSITPYPRWASRGRTSRRKKRKRAQIPPVARRRSGRNSPTSRAKSR